MDFSGFSFDAATQTRLQDEPMTPTEYRKFVAIPRYLQKRECRNFKRRIVHPSRVDAAFKKNRVGGRFA